MRTDSTQRAWIAVALGSAGAAIAWSAIGLLGLIAGIGAIILGSTERSRARRGSQRFKVATGGLALGCVAGAIFVAVVAVTIINATADGTFDN